MPHIRTSIAALCAYLVLAALPAHAREFKTLYTFTGKEDGGMPLTHLLFLNGVMFGTTRGGGTGCNGGGCGVIFDFDLATGTESPIIDLKNIPQGQEPNDLTAVDGIFYGTNGLGGKGEFGTLFQLDPATGAYTVLYSFPSPGSGSIPAGKLAYHGGYLYGITENSSHSYYGTVFKYGIESKVMNVLYTFGPNSDAALPNAIIYQDGFLYGTAPNSGNTHCLAGGCGTVFKIDAETGAETVLYAFKGHKDGDYPIGLLYQNGMLYGVTERGGASHHGTVYQLDPVSGAKTILYSFQAKDDSRFPNSTLNYLDGALYGTSGLRLGEENCDYSGRYCGTVFKIDVATGTETILHGFPRGKGDNLPEGGLPHGGVTYHNGAFYGTAQLGAGRGCDHYGCGTIFKIKP